MSYNDGQHRDRTPAVNNGQRTVRNPAAAVGNQSGGEQAMSVPPAECGADIETTRGPGAGAGFPGNAATHKDADD